MLGLSALDTKILRDCSRMRGQLIAIALVIACGVGIYLGMRATMHSLESARASYYAQERFGDVFASLVRAPEHIAARLLAIPGVQRLQTRVVANVTLDVANLSEAASGRLVSLPDKGRPQVNDIHLRNGRMPAAGRWNEVLVSEAFADANGYAPGARIATLINGKHQELEIVGTALSPEYTYAVAPGQLFPDDRRFGVIWMRRQALATAFDMQGAFNDVSLRLTPTAHLADVLKRVDAVLDRYGGQTAIARKDQQSAFFVENELTQLRSFALMLPALFLVVAAFLLNVVVSRIVSGQREQIAAMKAFGYRDREVGLHYAKLVGLVTLGGCVLGTLFATWMGAAMTRLYADYYRFPELPFRMSSRDLIEGIAMSCIAAAVGTRSAIRRTIALPPAEAMRPEPPASYRKTIIERLGVAHYLPTAARVVLRELERRPGRAAFSIFGIAMAAALTIVNSFTFDSVKHMLNVQFGLNQREDVQLTLVEPRSIKVLAELRQLPGVLHAEPFRAVAVRMSSGQREKTTSISGVPIDASLTTLLDRDLRNVPLPPDGVVLARKLAEALDVSTGDSVRMEILEGARPVVTARVARIVETFIGIGAHMNLPALCRLLGETETLNGAWLLVDDARLDELNAAVKARPIIAGVTSRDSVLRQVREMLDGNLLALVGISLGFSLVMAFGVLYNAVRITLSERARDLASLRVLGYRRGEVATILLGEIGLLILVALPLGLLIGRALAGVLVTSPGFDTEQFRLPLVITPMTYVSAVLTVLAAALVSSWTAWRRLDQIDLVEVLKTRD